jgi:hypothetical protein
MQAQRGEEDGLARPEPGGASRRGEEPMRYRKTPLALVIVLAALVAMGAGANARSTTTHRPDPPRPSRVLIVVMDQMRPGYVDQFDMDNVRRLQHRGVDYRRAYLGHMASETVVSHNVMVSGLYPKHMGGRTRSTATPRTCSAAAPTRSTSPVT